MLFKIEAAVRPCNWNDDFVKEITGVQIKDVTFYKAKKKPSTNSESSTGLPKDCEMSTLQRLSLSQQKDLPVVLSKFADFNKQFCHKAPVPIITKLPKSLRELYAPNLNSEEAQKGCMRKRFQRKTKILLKNLPHHKPTPWLGMQQG